MPKGQKKLKRYGHSKGPGICPKCKSENTVLLSRIDCDGGNILKIYMKCRDCKLAFIDIWEAKYFMTEANEDVIEKPIVKKGKK